MSNYYTPQFRFGPVLTPIIKHLIIINAVIFIVQFVFMISKSSFLIDMFGFHPEKIRNFYWHQFFTYAFLHADFFHLLFNMLTLWMFGSELENLWGKKNFIYFYGIGILFVSFLSFFIDNFFQQGGMIGASAVVTSIMVIYGMLWPNREVLFMLIFPIKIKYIIFLILIPMMIFYTAGSGGSNFAANLGGVLYGFGYWYLSTRYKLDFEKLFDFDDYMRRKKFKMYQEEMESRAKTMEKVDELLDKISKHGYNSLTEREKKFLNEASRKYYNE